MSALNTRAQMEELIQSDLNVNDNSSLFPPATVRLALDRAYRKAGGLFKWPQLRHAMTTTTQLNIENYDYPDIFRPYSIYKVEVNGERWGEQPDGSPITFRDYLLWKEDNPNKTFKKWANESVKTATGSITQYFLFPVPSTADLEICIWGYINVTALSSESSTTIFSTAMPECNEAIVLEAVAILQKKGEKSDRGEFESVEAKQILAISFNKLIGEDSKYEKLQPQFNVPNFYPPNRSSRRRSQPIGNFARRG